MKIKVIGKVHLKGTSRRTGDPYDFIQVHYIVKTLEDRCTDLQVF